MTRRTITVVAATALLVLLLGAAAVTEVGQRAVELLAGPDAPTAAYSYSPAEPGTDEAVRFDASASTCPAEPCSYSWTGLDRPDGNQTRDLGTGQQLQHTFSQRGETHVRLTVTDGQGRSDRHTRVVTVGGAQAGSPDGQAGSTFEGITSGTVTIPPGFPTPSDTGLEAAGVDPDELPEYEGPYTISSGRHVIEGKHLTGQLTVSGSARVIVRASLIEHDGTFGVYTKFSDPGTLVIEDSDVRMTGSGSKGVVGHNITVRNSDVRYGEDLAYVQNDVLIEDSFLADPGHPSRGDDPHFDAVQSVGGSGLTIRRSTVLGRWRGQTSAMILSAALAPLTDVTLRGNFVSGGNYTVYLTNKPARSTPRNVTVADNVWNAGSWQYGPIRLDCGSSWTWRRNTDTDGEPIPGC